jgi:hypothetical protein
VSIRSARPRASGCLDQAHALASSHASPGLSVSFKEVEPRAMPSSSRHRLAPGENDRANANGTTSGVGQKLGLGAKISTISTVVTWTPSPLIIRLIELLA